MFERTILAALALAAANLAACGGGGSHLPSDGGGAQAVAVDVGDEFSCALTSGGGVKCWGYNSAEQLGNPDYNQGDSTFTPVDVVGLTSVGALSAGEAHACVLVGSAVKCWGWGFYGQTSDPSYYNNTTPISVGVTAPVSVSAGLRSSCAALGDGKVQCWGINDGGQLGNASVATGTMAKSWSPVYVDSISTATAVSVAWDTACALLEDATVRCWGGIFSGSVGTWPDLTWLTHSVPISNLTNVVKLASGVSHHCALLADGAVRCWGLDPSGARGGSAPNATTAVEPAGVGTATAVAAGAQHSCAVVTGGQVKCWGGNAFGQLGDGTRTNSSTAVTVGGLTGATAVAAGDTHTCAVLGTGRVKCWGGNSGGQLGLDPAVATSSVTPLDVRL